MTQHPDAIPGTHIPKWLLWARLPFQPVMIAWVWYVSLRKV